ncbi:hypothetical protein JB92DRAFT_1163112 [Gautieria morchelliformis]|nr:hypothetical protein JB92DRAFT_1163112 [Gautieria morchelliformis]
MFRTASRTPAPSPPSSSSPPAPSTYTKGLQPVASADIRAGTNAARHSKTNLDFESALRAEGTFQLREGPDVAALGVVESSPAPQRRPNTNTTINTIVVPPTPEGRTAAAEGSVQGPSSSSSPHPSSPSPQDVSPSRDPDALELQNKRRSMFRSPGSASSPDLATLLRKAKEKESAGGAMPGCGLAATQRQAQEEGGLAPNEASGAGFLSPSQTSPRLRGSSSTSSFSAVSGAPRMPAKEAAAEPPGRPSLSDNGRNSPGASPSAPKSQWSLTSSRARSGSKSGKSMRSRASNFLGKILGQESSVRDKQKDEGSSTPTTPVYTAPPLFARYANYNPPPVPQLPEPYRFASLSSSTTTDVFNNAPTSPDYSKPLPTKPKTSHRTSEEEVEQAIAASLAPERTIKPRLRDGHVRSHSRGNGSTSSARRRSASVGDLEWAKPANEVANSVPPAGEPPREPEPGKASAEWDTSAIISMLQGELSQLDPISATSLEITDPSTPARRPSPSRSRNPEQTMLSRDGTGTIRPKASASRPAPPSITTVTERQRADHDSTASPRSPASPKRTSLNIPDSPIRSTARRAVSRPTPPISASAIYASRTVSTPTLSIPPVSAAPANWNATSPVFSNPFMSQPSVVVNGGNPSSPREPSQMRSPASNSEPVLVAGNEVELGPRRGSQPQIHTKTPDYHRTVRLVPSTTSFAYPNGQGYGSASQVDLGDASPAKSIASSSVSPARGVSMEGDDMDARGQELAQRCWTDDETFLPKEKIAEWLGGAGRINSVALHYYMDFYDFAGLRLDHAFRRFCAKLYLKGETQQIDRILSEFSRRYWECNPNSLYGGASVVHAVAYSILLLNTDLHIADLSTHMSRNQFVRNTVQAIQSQIRTAPNLERASTPDLMYDDASSAHAEGSEVGGSTVRSRPKRSSSVHSWTSVSRDAISSTGTSSTAQLTTSPIGPASQNASTVSVQTPTSGQIPASAEPRIRTAGSQSSVTSIVYGRNWDGEMESLLRDMYAAIKSQEIRQPTGFQPPSSQMSSLAPNTPYNTLMRHRSQRGQDRMAILKRGSIRGIQTLLGQQTGVSPYSSNSSIEGRDPRDGRVSPSPSFATSLEGISATSTFFTPALGFASNLSHTIIREAQEDDIRSLSSDNTADTSVSISDEELALLGAPWAKEGMLCRKQYWESSGKRARSRTWQDVFVVIQKGELDMFIFGERGTGGAQNVGGGNWLANAQTVGNVALAHSLAHALPPPGYNRQRPHCFVLTLASGGVFFFQAGTEDLLNEWVTTCNYWAARQSKEPLAGGVSNMEYGWNRVLDPVTQITTIHDDAGSIADVTDTFSMRSGKSTKKRSWPDPNSIGRSHDRIFINEWKAPLPSTVSSTHDEETQLEALQKQVVSLKQDLQTHNELRRSMSALYAPRSSNLSKAETNWEKKSQYLLTEIVKYETYVESLKNGMSLRLKKRGEKALEKALVTASPHHADFTAGATGRVYPEDDTIFEGDEPSTPGPTSEFRHRRERAQGDDDDPTTP